MPNPNQFTAARKVALVAAAMAGSGSVLFALQKDEGVRNASYIDNVGVATECSGHTKGVVLGTVKSDKECFELLKQDAQQYGLGIANCLDREPPLETFRSYIRFGVNVGTYGFCTSTVRRKANEGDWKGSCDAMLMWNRGKASNPVRDCLPGTLDKKTGKCAIRGIDNRRHDERAQCLKGVTP